MVLISCPEERCSEARIILLFLGLSLRYKESAER
jgi:hypothetical protein